MGKWKKPMAQRKKAPEPPVSKRKGFRSIPIPDEAGKLLNCIMFHELLVCACENGVWIMDPETERFSPVRFDGTNASA